MHSLRISLSIPKYLSLFVSSFIVKSFQIWPHKYFIDTQNTHTHTYKYSNVLLLLSNFIFVYLNYWNNIYFVPSSLGQSISSHTTTHTHIYIVEIRCRLDCHHRHWCQYEQEWQYVEKEKSNSQFMSAWMTQKSEP